MKVLFSDQESKVPTRTEMARKEINDYLNSGKSLRRWEHFIKCMTSRPSDDSRYRNMSLKENIEKMVLTQPGDYMVLERILEKYGMNAFKSASVNIFVNNKDYFYFKETYGMKILVRN